MSKIATSKGIFEINIPLSGNGEHYITCPICTPTRKPEHHKEKKFAVNLGKDPMPWRCNHCKESGYVLTEEYLSRAKIKPVLKNYDYLPISDPVVKWFWEKRKISVSTLRHFDISMNSESILLNRISPGEEHLQGKWVTKKCINYKYKKDDVLVNIKFRDPVKNFKMIPGASLIPYNIDSIKGSKWAVITEGENDVLAYHEAGITPVISVPNGASITDDEKKYYIETGKIRIMSSINLDYLDPVLDDLKDIEMFYIATDDDPPGVKLRQELARRLGFERCKYIRFGDYKDNDGKPINDPNELLIKRGKALLAGTIENAKVFPIEGVTIASDHEDEIHKNYHEGKTSGVETGFASLDPFFKWIRGWTIVINGFPKQGKTSFALVLMLISAVKYKWKWGIYCPENYPRADLIEIMVSILINKPVEPGYSKRATYDEMRETWRSFIDKYFFFVDREEGYTPEELREIKRQMIKQHGITGFLTDPWSALNHRFTDVDHYIEQQLNFEGRLNTKYKLINLICHHPKTIKDSGDLDKPPSHALLTGGQRWWSKANAIVCVHQEKSNEWLSDKVGFHVQAMRNKQRGGETTNETNYPIFRYDRLSRRIYEREDPKDENSKFTRFPFVSYMDGNQGSIFEGF